MRLQVYGWMLWAGLWAGDAAARETAEGREAAAVPASGCAGAVAALAAEPAASAERDAAVEAICTAEAARPRHDPETEAALQQWQQAHLGAIGRHVRTLMASGDPHDLLAAALIAPSAGGPLSGEAFEWISDGATAAFAAARRLGPDDRLVAWLEAVDCPRAAAGSGCDPQAALVRLQRLEPDNAAVWIFALEAAVANADEASIDRLLARAAAASRYGIPFAGIGLLVTRTLLEVDSPPMTPPVAQAVGLDFGLGRAASAQDVAGVGAMAIAAAVALPAYQPLQGLCIGQDGKPPLARRSPACIAIYTHMAQDGLLTSQSIALTNLVRLTADSVAGTQWRERLRQMHWIRGQGAKAMGVGIPEGYLQSVWRLGELPAIEAMLRAAGVPTTPPPGWLPDEERLRALIAPGRPPPRG